MACSSFMGRLIGGRPKCRTFYLEIDPEAFVSELPSVFYRKFRDELSSKIFFRDNHGNEIELYLERGLLDCIIIDGYMQLCNFYNLHNGGWLKVYYSGDSVFSIRVRDIDMCRVQYPYPPRRLTLDDPIAFGLHDVPFYDAIPHVLPHPNVQALEIGHPPADLFLQDSQIGEMADGIEPIVEQADGTFPHFFQHSDNTSEVSALIVDEIGGHATNEDPVAEANNEAIAEATHESIAQPTMDPISGGNDSKSNAFVMDTGDA